MNIRRKIHGKICIKTFIGVNTDHSNYCICGLLYSGFDAKQSGPADSGPDGYRRGSGSKKYRIGV